MRGVIRLGLIGPLGLGIAAFGCAGRQTDLECADGMTREQCVFVSATRPTETPTDTARPATPGVQPSVLTEPGWERVDEILRDGVNYLQGGSGALDAIASRWCASDPTPQESEAGTVWVCALKDAPRLRGHELSLEFDRYSLFSLTGFGYSQTEGRELVRAGTQRWSTWCRTRNFTELESLGIDEFHRCALSDGPMLIVGRFARDVDADLWQVSLAVIGPG